MTVAHANPLDPGTTAPRMVARRRPPPPPLAAPTDRFLQLRHQTKNALQRIIQLIDTAPELTGSPELRGLSVMLQQRIMLTAQLSDALFGLTRAPGPFADRLSELCHGVRQLLGDPAADITLDVTVKTTCPASLEDTILRVAHELVGNAVTHGLHARLVGHIEVRLEAIENRLVLTVSDDGWGCGPRIPTGGGLSLVDMLAAPLGGDLRLRRIADRTVASLSVSR